MKKTWFAKILIVMLCLSLVLCGCNKSEGENGGKSDSASLPNTPEEIADTSYGRTLSAIFGGDGNWGLLGKNMDCSKVTVSVGDYVDNVMYIDTNRMQIADELNVNFDGVEVEAGIYLNENELVLTLPGLVDGAYGVNLDTLVDDLKDSELLALLGINMDQLEEEYGFTLDAIDDMLDTMDAYVDEMESLADSALKNVDKTVTEGKVTVDGQEVDAITVTYSLDSEGLKNIVNELGTWYTDYMKDLAAAVKLDMGLDSVIGEIDGVMAEVETALSELDFSAKVVVNVNAETGYIMTVDGEVEATVEGETATFTLDVDLGVNAAESDKYTLTVGAVADGEQMDVLKLVLKRESTDAKENYDLSVKAAGFEVANAQLAYDKGTGAYELEVNAADVEFALKGTYKLTDKSMEFSVESINLDGDKTEINAKVLVEKISASSIPKMPEYKNILKLSQQDILDLVNEFSETMNQFYIGESTPNYDSDYDFDEYWDDYDI